MERSDKIKFLRTVSKKFFSVASPSVSCWIACQFALESDFGRSELCSLHNNFCGMKSPVLRINANISPGTSFSHFISLDVCCLDYMLWLAYNKATRPVMNDVRAFGRFVVKNGYCPDAYYKDRIDQLFDDFKTDVLSTSFKL